LSTASNWIGIQTGVDRFDYQTPYKPVVSKSSEANIWLYSYDHLTDVGGQSGGISTSLAAKGRVLYTHEKEA